MKTFIISLKDEVARRNSISDRLHHHDFEFFDAVDLRVASDDVLSAVKCKNINYKHPAIREHMTKGELGCALSHMQLYKKIVDDNLAFARVIEDDAVILNHDEKILNDFILALETKNIDWDIMLLGYSKLKACDSFGFYLKEPIKNIVKSGAYSLGIPFRNWTCGTVGYLVSQSGAKKMINNAAFGKVCTVADDWLFFEKNYNLKILHIRPLIVLEDFESYESSIETDRKTYVNHESHISFFLRVMRGVVRKVYLSISWKSL
ncbi:glycosyltransferase family 25 protein [Edwardsiella ictaluri]|uniref:glycosyltransferase family 25 protein n=1 Tax=Edwardsiella ictaluri TaxID=67780 RepID=UPI0018DC2C52|nr:glycosyltransferase family 25 protein [Edwardsiella ictaluri]QPW26368.1 glycosyltransferase family 25 protein [Edwardsiella ictaluri]